MHPPPPRKLLAGADRERPGRAFRRGLVDRPVLTIETRRRRRDVARDPPPPRDETTMPPLADLAPHGRIASVLQGPGARSPPHRIADRTVTLPVGAHRANRARPSRPSSPRPPPPAARGGTRPDAFPRRPTSPASTSRRRCPAADLTRSSERRKVVSVRGTRPMKRIPNGRETDHPLDLDASADIARPEQGPEHQSMVRITRQ